MKMEFPNGVWPVMLTPFDENKNVDYDALRELVDWYIEKGVHGLFAVCQSSEMFFLTDEEAVEIVKTVKHQAAGRVPVIASGHTADTLEDQAKQIQAIYAAGADAVVLITNRLAKENESDEIWRDHLNQLLTLIPEEIPLAFYECPRPYKRLISLENLSYVADIGRFYFLKDTCCDAELIKQRIEAVKGKTLKIFNANTTTLLETMLAGAAGFSGVMANFHPELYVWLCENQKNERADELSDWLTITSLIERQCYPVNAKYYLQGEGLHLTTKCRRRDDGEMTETFKKEVEMLRSMTKRMKKSLLKD